MLGFMDAVFPLMFSLVFLMVMGVFAVTIFQSISRWNKNNNSPRLTVDAKILAKRTNLTRHRSSNGHHHNSTTYFVTFEVESGDRMELQLRGNEYGLLIEGDTGRLTFQGTRYLNFERHINL